MTAVRVITALDFPNANTALDLAKRLDPAITHLKVGNELFTSAGPALVEQLQNLGFRVFLDLKFHDIPNTVAGGVRSAAALGVWMVNVHIGGGRRMLAAAREAIPATSETLLIGVTVLTSLTQDDLPEVGVERQLHEHVISLATLAQECGLHGVVCSPLEAATLQQRCGASFVLVTPGVRLHTSDTADQRRVLSPKNAIAAGSHYLVIGRPITQAPDPQAACESIVASIQ